MLVGTPPLAGHEKGSKAALEADPTIGFGLADSSSGVDMHPSVERFRPVHLVLAMSAGLVHASPQTFMDRPDRDFTTPTDLTSWRWTSSMRRGRQVEGLRLK